MASLSRPGLAWHWPAGPHLHLKAKSHFWLAACTEDSRGGLAEDFVQRVMKVNRESLNQKVHPKEMEPTGGGSPDSRHAGPPSGPGPRELPEEGPPRQRSQPAVCFPCSLGAHGAGSGPRVLRRRATALIKEGAVGGGGPGRGAARGRRRNGKVSHGVW
uniref:Uncharacterized protein n=1 Tax=Molossus molossus TaxID=27622 RepID=A0A7J8JYC4_MOLMO|nr:hypothetical protein HJG59_008101 [Molossus molossus]